MTALPSPVTSAPPMARRSRHRAATSGSRAALRTVTSPSAPMAAIRMFSVAPTLGKGSSMTPPRRRSQRQRSSSPDCSTRTPIASRAFRCRSMGLRPIQQPPGSHRHASPQRARSAPRKTTEERRRSIMALGIRQRHRPLLSTSMTPGDRRTAHPRWARISAVASTSLRAGQRFSRYLPGSAAVAASRGSTAFFAPLI